ncbi:MAG: lysylphosphatidylglycerol synthase transmembrane domain-containing protein [Pyrinomonadaceae bacterium]
MRKHLKFILLILIAVSIFWFFGRDLDLNLVAQSLGKAKAVYIISAVLIICAGYLLRAKRWQVLLEPITETSLKELFATTAVGFTAVFLIGRAGEIVRPMWLPMRDKRVRPSAALVTLGIERVFDLASLICFFSLNLLWFEAPAGREKELAYIKTVGYILLGGTFAGILALYVYQRVSPGVISRVERVTSHKFIPDKIARIIVSIFKQLAKSLEILRDWREIVSVTFWTVLLWLAIALPTWLVLLAFDLPLDFSDALFIVGWAAIGSVVPTPGGAAGAFHAATAGGLIFMNVAQEQAAAVSIAMHLVYFAPAVIFGLYYFVHGDISYSRFKNLLSSDLTVDPADSASGR